MSSHVLRIGTPPPYNSVILLGTRDQLTHTHVIIPPSSSVHSIIRTMNSLKWRTKPFPITLLCNDFSGVPRIQTGSRFQYWAWCNKFLAPKYFCAHLRKLTHSNPPPPPPPVLCNTLHSRNTPHQTSTTHQPTPITHHPSPITHHPSPITHHPSPITHHHHHHHR